MRTIFVLIALTMNFMYVMSFFSKSPPAQITGSNLNGLVFKYEVDLTFKQLRFEVDVQRGDASCKVQHLSLWLLKKNVGGVDTTWSINIGVSTAHGGYMYSNMIKSGGGKYQWPMPNPNTKDKIFSFNHSPGYTATDNGFKGKIALQYDKIPGVDPIPLTSTSRYQYAVM